MDIIIVGCGKVGFTLVEQLSNEDHNIVVIDEKPEKVQYITDRLDVMGIVGNGINHKTLLEAGIATADLLIAVTGDDEKNLKEDLMLCHSKNKSGLRLSLWDTLDSSAVNYREIACIVKDKCNRSCKKSSAFTATPDWVS